MVCTLIQHLLQLLLQQGLCRISLSRARRCSSRCSRLVCCTVCLPHVYVMEVCGNTGMQTLNGATAAAICVAVFVYIQPRILYSRLGCSCLQGTLQVLLLRQILKLINVQQNRTAAICAPNSHKLPDPMGAKHCRI